jgi:hypothetical protein
MDAVQGLDHFTASNVSLPEALRLASVFVAYMLSRMPAAVALRAPGIVQDYSRDGSLFPAACEACAPSQWREPVKRRECSGKRAIISHHCSLILVCGFHVVLRISGTASGPAGASTIASWPLSHNGFGFSSEGCSANRPSIDAAVRFSGRRHRGWPHVVMRTFSNTAPRCSDRQPHRAEICHEICAVGVCAAARSSHDGAAPKPAIAKADD